MVSGRLKVESSTDYKHIRLFGIACRVSVRIKSTVNFRAAITIDEVSFDLYVNESIDIELCRDRLIIDMVRRQTPVCG
jgi:hypothetical protein